MIKQFWVAFSGGLDSHVLLHFLAAEFSNTPIHAIHINHQLLPESMQWEEHCQNVCHALNIPLTIKRVTIDRQPGQSIEALAREARYAAFAELIQTNDLLFTAHHQDDQAETVLLQLFRGAGLRGVSAMPKITPFAQGYLVRPLLKFSQQDLIHYANTHHLQWIEDPSNSNMQFARNYLRSIVLPQIQQRWPKINHTLSRFAKHCVEQEQLLQTIAQADLASCLTKTTNNLIISRLNNFSSIRQSNILREWFRILQLRMPSSIILKQIQTTILSAKRDANPTIYWQNHECYRFRDELRIEKVSATHVAKLKVEILQAFSTTQKEWCKINLPFDLQHENIIIKYREGGERFKPAGSQHHRTLKNLLQEWHVPPRERQRIPLIFNQDKLIAVVGYAVADTIGLL